MWTGLGALLGRLVLAVPALGALLGGGASPALLLLLAVSGAAVLVVALAVAAVVLGLVRPVRHARSGRTAMPVPARQSDPRAAGRPQPRAPGAAA